MDATDTLSDQQVEEMMEAAFHRIRAGKTDEAIALLTTVADQRRTLVYAWFLLGLAYQQNSNYESAIDAYTIAHTLDPLHAFAHYHKAECLLSLKRVEEGLAQGMAATLCSLTTRQPFPYSQRVAVFAETWSNQAAYADPQEVPND